MRSPKVSVAPVKQAQEMKALLFVVGKLLPRSLRDGHGKLPDEKWFEPILETYNLKVERKIDAKKLRAIIAQKLSYIRRRAKVQREPWYKPYFLHFLGDNLEGIQIAKEPADFNDREETTPVKQMVQYKRKYPGSVDREDSSPSLSKRRRSDTPDNDSEVVEEEYY